MTDNEDLWIFEKEFWNKDSVNYAFCWILASIVSEKIVFWQYLRILWKNKAFHKFYRRYEYAIAVESVKYPTRQYEFLIENLKVFSNFWRL